MPIGSEIAAAILRFLKLLKLENPKTEIEAFEPHAARSIAISLVVVFDGSCLSK